MPSNDESAINIRNAHKKITCPFCNELRQTGKMKKHKECCYLNPGNIKHCAVCGKILKGFRWATTCSYVCSNRHLPFARIRKFSRKDLGYQTICFEHHGKKCLVCEEAKIVAVHHVNHDNKDNRPENLVPLCPTHHCYVHSKHRKEILLIVEKYLNKFNGLVPFKALL